jgi:5'-deoxynucleotidase YfbR-like HD superfamily hydrolase
MISPQTMETYSGKMIDILNPAAEDIDITDIAWALSRLSRFCGHTTSEQPYTVAQHCILVAELTENFLLQAPSSSEMPKHATFSGQPIYEIILKALLHDGHEAYISDIPSPVKRHPALMPVITAMEEHLDRAIYQKFNLTQNTPEIISLIKRYDMLALKSEAKVLMKSGGAQWADSILPKYTPIALGKIMTTQEAFTGFKDKFNSAVGKLRVQRRRWSV